MGPLGFKKYEKQARPDSKIQSKLCSNPNPIFLAGFPDLLFGFQTEIRVCLVGM